MWRYKHWSRGTKNMGTQRMSAWPRQLRGEHKVMRIRLTQTTVLFAALLFLNGCAVGPHYKAPQPATVTYHATDPKLVTEAPFDPRWWKQFEDPVLESLVDRTVA